MTGLTDFSGRVAVVTGGASGIGRGMAEEFISRGCHVVIADIEQEALQATASEIGAVGIRCDVADSASVQNLADEVSSRFGRVDIVCNNAGIGPRGPLADLTLADWKWMLDVNLWGVINGIHAFLPLLKENPAGGWIVNTASVSVLQTPKFYGSYVASKAAVLSLSEVLAAELAFESDSSGSSAPPLGVTVLIPGPVRTNIMNSTRNRPDDARGTLFDHDIATTIPDSWRWSSPREVGALVAEAVARGELYAPTHPEFLDGVQERHSSIERSFSLDFSSAPQPSDNR